jgi:hypothetical protein
VTASRKRRSVRVSAGKLELLARGSKS